MDRQEFVAPPGFADFSKTEQIEYLQALWDQIAESPEELPVPESHIALAERRLADYRRDPTLARPAFEDLDRLVKKYGG
ncbi:MAG TPA: addiction module protein [Thermoanaerobaculia bacterium]|jgi:putative addiction module component (TIGR02574 family)|nr:addiction module protein [Thermoanaerobaculia bacterium]